MFANLGARGAWLLGYLSRSLFHFLSSFEFRAARETTLMMRPPARGRVDKRMIEQCSSIPGGWNDGDGMACRV